MLALGRLGELSALARRGEPVGDWWHRGVRHPVVVTFTVINLAIIAATLPSL